MKRPSSIRAGAILASVFTAGALLLPAAQARTAVHAVPTVCTINVVTGADNCTGVPGVTILAKSNGQVLVKLAIVVGNIAHITATYNQAPTGFNVNIGDSSSNDGGGGDSGTQSNDAEMMIQGQVMSVFGRDGTATAPVLTVPSTAIGNGSVAIFDISDRKLCWSFGTYTCATSDSLYALNNEADSQGPVNNDIYAAFNRVINGTYRTGTGVSSVTVSAS
jgi:hypothetical protein